MLDRTHAEFTALFSAEADLSEYINTFDVTSKMTE
jgi:hypothetical protein